jgi:DNA-binding NarL/FixJ family response regulator
MSVSTVKLHLRQILEKLKLHSRAELIAVVARSGLMGE